MEVGFTGWFLVFRNDIAAQKAVVQDIAVIEVIMDSITYNTSCFAQIWPLVLCDNNNATNIFTIHNQVISIIAQLKYPNKQNILKCY